MNEKGIKMGKEGTPTQRCATSNRIKPDTEFCRPQKLHVMSYSTMIHSSVFISFFLSVPERLGLVTYMNADTCTRIKADLLLLLLLMKLLRDSELLHRRHHRLCRVQMIADSQTLETSGNTWCRHCPRDCRHHAGTMCRGAAHRRTGHYQSCLETSADKISHNTTEWRELVKSRKESRPCSWQSTGWVFIFITRPLCPYMDTPPKSMMLDWLS